MNTNHWSGGNLNNTEDSRTKEYGKTDDGSITKAMEFKGTKCTTTRSSEMHKLTNRITEVLECKQHVSKLPKQVYSINAIMKAHRRHLALLKNKIKNINANDLLNFKNIGVKQNVPLTATSECRKNNFQRHRATSKIFKLSHL